MNTAASVMGKFVSYVLNPTILIIFAWGFFYFMWGLMMFLWNIEKGATNNEGKAHMLWGIVGMLIMVSVSGIIMLMNNTFDLGLNYSGNGNFNANPDMSRAGLINSPINFR